MTKLDKRFLAQQCQYLQSPSCHFQLTGLYDELTAATNTLTLAISTTICKHTPGPWRKSIIVHMPATPSRPSQPRIELTSHGQGTLTVRRLSQEEEHGSSAKALIIETCIPRSKEWISREVEINPNMGHPIQADVLNHTIRNTSGLK